LRGLDIVGFYHSHPHSPARPSARDLAEATYVDALYLIVSLEADPPVVRAYTLVDGRFLEVGLRIGDAGESR
jgi:proteasome lid subunit RPN8/RPN11